jgi:hypothetical protein
MWATGGMKRGGSRGVEEWISEHIYGFGLLCLMHLLCAHAGALGYTTLDLRFLYIPGLFFLLLFFAFLLFWSCFGAGMGGRIFVYIPYLHLYKNDLP